jgi:hypothetical protein
MADDVVTGLIKGNESLNRQFIDNLRTLDMRRIANERIKFNYETQRVRSEEVDSSVFILSHPIQCLLVETSDDTDGFFLVDEDEGYTESVERVVSLNNTFTERFIHTNFVDEDLTTATVTTSSGRVDFDAGEVLQTEVIALNNEAYTGCRVIPTGEYSELDLEISFDGGTTFNSAEWNTNLSVTNTSTDGIVIKVSETTTTGLGFPVTMPVTFTADSTSDYLTKLKIQYS